MTKKEKVEYLFRKKFTDEDFEKETDIDKIIYMAINYKAIYGIWSKTVQKKIEELLKPERELSKKQKIMLMQLGFDVSIDSDMEDTFYEIKNYEEFLENVNFEEEAEKENNKIIEDSLKRIKFDKSIGCYTIDITDYVGQVFGNDIVKNSRIICPKGYGDFSLEGAKIEAYNFCKITEHDFQFEKTLESKETYIETTFINDKKVGCWSNDIVTIEESRY